MGCTPAGYGFIPAYVGRQHGAAAGAHATAMPDVTIDDLISSDEEGASVQRHLLPQVAWRLGP